MDYGSDLVEHFLLSELHAEGHITYVGRNWVFSSGNHDYEVTLRARKIKRKTRLTE